MKNKNILLTADWHLGKSQYKDPRRKAAFFIAAFNVIKQAIDNNISYILNAGDLLDSCFPDQETVYNLKKLHEHMNNNKITMFCISGNHDNTLHHWIDLFDGEYGFKNIDNKFAELESGVKIYGIKGTHKNDIIKSFKENSLIKDCDIILMHTPCKQFISYSGDDDKIFDLEKDEIKSIFQNSNIKYVLIGDTHVTQTFHYDQNSTEFVSPGSIEMCDSKEPISKYVFNLNSDTWASDLVQIKPDYNIIRTNLVKNEKDLDDILQHFINSDLPNTKTHTLLYYYYRPDVKDAFMRVKNLLGNNKNILICYKPKNIISQYESSIKESTELSKDQDTIQSLKDFVNTSLHKTSFLSGLSDKGENLLLACVDKNADIKLELTNYINK